MDRERGQKVDLRVMLSMSSFISAGRDEVMVNSAPGQKDSVMTSFICHHALLQSPKTKTLQFLQVQPHLALSGRGLPTKDVLGLNKKSV